MEGLRRKRLAADLRNVLVRARQGLTAGEVSRLCGKGWRKQLAKWAGTDSATIEIVRDFIHELWSEGVVVVEPPRGKQTGGKVWAPEVFASRKSKPFRRKPLARPRAAEEKEVAAPASGRADEDAFRAVYEEMQSDHFTGAVPIFKLRRALNWPRERFDRLISALSSRKTAPAQLVGGNAAALSAEQRQDSFVQDGELYLNVVWKS